jgi:D-glycero-D-manno-heptose 1,7-bisphosphate phosphatase
MKNQARNCVFLDRDGVLNHERGEYTFKVEDFRLIEGVQKALQLLKDQDFYLVVITNQAGISRGIYSRQEMQACHEKLMSETGGIIDALYYSPYHPLFTESLSRKPGTLLFQRAIARFNINASASWMIGDQERDLIPAKKLGIKTIIIEPSKSPLADYSVPNLAKAAEHILKHN